MLRSVCRVTLPQRPLERQERQLKAAGTFVVGIQSGFTGDTTGKIVYNGAQARVVAVQVTATIKPAVCKQSRLVYTDCQERHGRGGF